MDEDRLLRVRDKINYITSVMTKIHSPAQIELEKYGIFYLLQTVIETCIDLVAMITKDKGLDVQDDYMNIDMLETNGTIPSSLAEKLRTANGLRNRIVHQYNGFDETIALESIDDIAEICDEWIQLVEAIYFDQASA
ncbi:MAG TPA: DUF86 domain-containing protein [Candidatus Lokiarchaeia archaeon]|nr:DUF86 domain-containing protein [Candidatus Lokiarchaeia archaeon]